MKASDLDSIEAALGIQLPGYYKVYVQKFPKILLLINEYFEGEFFSTFYNDPDRLIELNKYLGVCGTEGIIKKKFCIGENGGGDYYLIDLKNLANEKVYLIDHEESVEDHYDEQRQQWDWNALEAEPNLESYKNFLLSLYGNPQSLDDLMKSDPEKIRLEFATLKKELFGL